MKVQKGIEFVTVAIFLLVLILLSFLLTTSRHHGRTNSHKEDSLREESSEQHKHYICNHKPSKLTLTEDETRPGTICGRVVRFSDNSPCRGAQVKIKRVRQPQPAFPQSESTKGWDAVTRTGAEGEFSFKNVSPGCLVILADYKGLPTLTLDNVWLPPA
ncbi:MAG: carboxypeptidase-like regulatory domain-containing protein [Planctomycetota bacterium]|nr:carboxypeptidase-like regulatory domain-containing protein [Planctomycetota bacterium]